MPRASTSVEMEESMRALFVLGRAMFGGFFAYNGVNHFRNQTMMSQYAEAKGVPAAEAAVPATGALLLDGRPSIMAGLQPEAGAAPILGVPISPAHQTQQFLVSAHHPQPQERRIHFHQTQAT